MGYTDRDYDYAGIGELQKWDDGSTADAPQEVESYLDER
jgi:hypothetical protein